MASDDLQALRHAVVGLTYPSESDEPFDVFSWPGQGSARDQVVARGETGRKVEEVPVETFFKQLDDADDAERFRELRRVAQFTLKGLQVFRVGVGEPEVDVYLIGRGPGGEWAGVHTVSVET